MLALHPPNFALSPRRSRGAKGAGERYEEKAQAFLSATYSDLYVPSPWFTFRDKNSTLRWCQPDGLLVNLLSGLITIVEIKLKHTAHAWWQIRRKYEPVLRNLFPWPLWSFSALEIVRWFDPHTSFPERLHLTDAADNCRVNRFHVLVWRGR